MPVQAEREGHIQFQPFMTESMTVCEAWTAHEVAQEFDGVQFRMLEPLNAEDAEVIASALNQRQLSVSGEVRDRQYGEKIYHMAQQSKERGQPTYPFVVISAQPDAVGNSSVFDGFSTRLHEVWQERKASAETAVTSEPKPQQRGVVARALGWLGIRH